jgi:hypothetical protein
MYNSAQDLLDALRATPEVLEALLDGYTQAQATAARGDEDEWSIVEVVCHLRDAEEQALARMRLMRDATDPVIAAYDQERWARERRYAEASVGSHKLVPIQFTKVSESRISSPPLACYDLLRRLTSKQREGICTYEDKRPPFRRAWRSAGIPLLV